MCVIGLNFKGAGLNFIYQTDFLFVHASLVQTEVSYGVPQDSVLGPIIYFRENTYISIAM